MTPLVAYLPDSMQAVSAVIGVEATYELAREFGGIMLDVPKKPTCATGRMLVQVIGKCAADKLCRAYGAQTLSIPRCAGLLTSVRTLAIHNAVREMERDGKSTRYAVRQAAKKWGYTERAIWRILQRRPDEPHKIQAASDQLQLALGF